MVCKWFKLQARQVTAPVNLHATLPPLEAEPPHRDELAIGVAPSVVSDRGGLRLHVSSTTILGLYLCLLAVNALLISTTLLSDLGYAMFWEIALRQFDLKQEGNFAVWCSSTILLFAGVAAGGRRQSGRRLRT